MEAHSLVDTLDYKMEMEEHSLVEDNTEQSYSPVPQHIVIVMLVELP